MITKKSEINSIDKKYIVAISYAGEKKDYVTKVATELSKGIDKKNIFFDEFHQSLLPGMGRDRFLNDTYKNAPFLVVFISSTYQDKVWCGIESIAIRERLHTEKGRGIIPVRFGKALTDWFSPALDTYIDGDKKTPKETAELILERIRIESSIPSARTTESPAIKANRRIWLLPVIALFVAISAYMIIKNPKAADTSKIQTDSSTIVPVKPNTLTNAGNIDTNNLGNVEIPDTTQKEKVINKITGGVYFNGNPVAGAIEVKVRVIDSKTKTGIENADVLIKEIMIASKTMQFGLVSFPSLPVRKVTIEVQKEGYLPTNEEIDITADKFNNIFSIELIKKNSTKL